MATSVTRTPIRVARSLARADLDQRQERRRQAREAAAAARQQLDQRNDQVEHAETGVRNAEATVTAIDAKESELVGDTWPPAAPPKALKQSRVEAEEALAVWRRTLATVRRNAELARVPADEATLAAVETEKEIDAAICRVLVEQAQAALSNMVDARATAALSESAVRSIVAVLSERKSFRAAEGLSMSLHQSARPEFQPNVAPYHRLAERLRNDPDAVVES